MKLRRTLLILGWLGVLGFTGLHGSFGFADESDPGGGPRTPESPRASKAPARTTNTIGMSFVRVRSGRYRRGFVGSEIRFHLAHPFSNRQSFGWEKPDHRVRIGRAFEIGVHEVTFGQFRAFVRATGYETDAEKLSGALGCFPEAKDYVDRFRKDSSVTWRSPGFAQSESHPVVAVSWRDAQAFCAWLSKKEGVRYRLPTEAEWEYACRAGTKTWYSWGEKPNDAYKHANVADGALEAAQPNTTRYQRAVGLGEKEGDGVVFTAKVGSFRANPWGLHDVHGNVWEWCEDRWSENVYRSYFEGVEWHERKKVLVRDPLFEDETDQHKYGDWRVIRGGAWTCAPASVRASIRAFAEARDGSVYTGFRVVRDVKSAED